MTEYARYTARLEMRIGKQYKEMLTKLKEAQKRSESEIARDILEKAILRRFKRLRKS